MQQLVYSISEHHPSLAGHFPGNPVVPAVVLLEELSIKVSSIYSGRYVREFTQVKFLKPVLPGEQIKVRLNATAKGRAGFRAYRDESLVFSGELVYGEARK